MLNKILILIAKFLLSLRYDIKIKGLDETAEKAKSKTVFLPNHPALIDPVIVFACLYPKFKVRAFGDRDQLERPFINWATRRFKVRRIPTIAKRGPSAEAEIEKKLTESIEGLKQGENLLIWPAGRLSKSRYERIVGTSSVNRIVKECPDVRVILVRTTGLWGSKFGWGWGKEPEVGPILKKGIFQILASGIFFMPKRKVEIELVAPDDFPKNADKNTINKYLEDFYNEKTQPNTYIPYSIWEKGESRKMPEPKVRRKRLEDVKVPDATREIIMEYLQEKTGIEDIDEKASLPRDLGMDSIARAEMVVWLEEEFGCPQVEVDSIQTVEDVMYAACGAFVYEVQPAELKDIPSIWFREKSEKRIKVPTGDTITQIFLNQAKKSPNGVVVADQISGVKTNRDIILACLVLQKKIKKISGDRIGIMMPASVTANLLYISTLFSEKTPVMVNWTVGHKHMKDSLETIGVKHILTSRTLIERFKSQKIDLSVIESKFVFIEDIAAQTSKLTKINAWLSSRLNWNKLKKAKVRKNAVILFTSGSETKPKAVPLTHKNMISDLKGVLEFVTIKKNDNLIGFLPSFHSFGLTVTILAPLLAGLRTAYHSNPMESQVIAEMIKEYKISMLVGTPSFLKGILRLADRNHLTTLRLSVTGADKCSESLYQRLQRLCPGSLILEGYGVTECSPIISINDENDPRPMTIGKVLPIMDYKILSTEDHKPVEKGKKGLLVVKGPNVFEGYLNYSSESAFIEYENEKWYNTGDLVTENEKGVITFAGRLKRFVKIGGEMVSLPAIESVLEKYFATESDEGPVLAIEANEEKDRPVLILFTTKKIDRQTANSYIRKEGLSGLHNIQKVVQIKEMPVLSTGKVNYRELKKLLKENKIE